MNEKFNKLITICFIFTFFLFNVFRILPIVEVVSAEDDYDENYVFGTLINASQGGRGGQGLKTGTRALGDSLSVDNRGGGQRLGNSPNSRGSYKFNPSLVDIDLIYNEYTTFVQQFYHDDIYVLPVNKHYSASHPENPNSGMIFDFAGNLFPHPMPDEEKFNKYIVPSGYTYMSADIDNSQGSFYYGKNTYAYTYTGNHTWRTESRNARLFIEDKNIYRIYTSAFESRPNQSIYIGNLYFYNSSSLDINNISIIHNSNHYPTKQEFINNYTNTFNLEYNPETNQLVQNNNYFVYDLDDFGDETLIINNDYVTNNYIEIIIEAPPIPDDSNSKDYTTLLERIISSIQELPQKISDLMPKPIYEAGTNFWDFLTDSLDNILDFLETLLMAILNLIFPNAEQLEESKGLLDNLFSTFSEKTEFITAPIQSFSSIYSTSRPAMFTTRNVSTNNNSTNLYNRTMVINDTELHILPASLEPAISAFRMVSTGVVVILTTISIYTRFRGVVKN